MQGFLIAVPEGNKEAYRKHAADAFPIFKDHGVTRLVEAWEEDVPDGELTDLRKAVKAEPGEKIVFSWMEFPSQEVARAMDEKMQSDPRMQEMGETMPFDGKRMIFGGFETVSDVGAAAGTGYVNGMVAAAPDKGREKYAAFAKRMAEVFQDHGATRLLDAWGVDVPVGKVTDFQSAVQAKEDEAIAFGLVEWPSKAVSDAGWEKMMADERMQGGEMPFDGKRMIFGGFSPLLDLS